VSRALSTSSESGNWLNQLLQMHLKEAATAKMLSLYGFAAWKKLLDHGI
jgi:hypothetical protein